MDLSGWQQAGAAPGADQVGINDLEHFQTVNRGHARQGLLSAPWLRGTGLGESLALAARLLICL